MERLTFIDANFHQLSETADKSERYAIDRGIISTFEDGRNRCYYVSAVPWLKNANREEASAFRRKLEKLNPEARFEMLELETIRHLNLEGVCSDFEITNCWTTTQDCDYFGAYGYYLLKNGREISDPGKERTDVYFGFWLIPGQEKRIVMP